MAHGAAWDKNSIINGQEPGYLEQKLNYKFSEHLTNLKPCPVNSPCHYSFPIILRFKSSTIHYRNLFLNLISLLGVDITTAVLMGTELGRYWRQLMTQVRGKGEAAVLVETDLER